MDKDHYPWIIWYLWKVRNDKLFIGIDRDPLELIRYVQGECQAWFSANTLTTYLHLEHVIPPKSYAWRVFAWQMVLGSLPLYTVDVDHTD